jgi:hypothetical protein
MLVVVLLLSVPLGWLGCLLERTRQQTKIVRRFDECQVFTEYRVGYVVSLSLGNPPFHAHLGPSDADLVHLKRLTKLEDLTVCSSNLTDAGLSHIREIATLKGLYLFNTTITDTGLVTLQKMTNLVELAVEDAQVTDNGLECLGMMTDLEMLSVSGNHVTDDGLCGLRGMTKLKCLDLRRTLVTTEGVETLQRDLPNCTIYHDFNPSPHPNANTVSSDLAVGQRSCQPREVVEKISETGGGVRFDHHEGVQTLQQALPNCQIIH